MFSVSLSFPVSYQAEEVVFQAVFLAFESCQKKLVLNQEIQELGLVIDVIDI